MKLGFARIILHNGGGLQSGGGVSKRPRNVGVLGGFRRALLLPRKDGGGATGLGQFQTVLADPSPPRQPKPVQRPVFGLAP